MERLVFGFKLHLITNSNGEITRVQITPANVSDLTPVEGMCQVLKGRIYGDKGYLSKGLRKILQALGIQLKAKPCKKMPADYLSAEDKKIIKKRNIVETIIGELKARHRMNHSRHRSKNGFLSNVWGAIVGYMFRTKKHS